MSPAQFLTEQLQAEHSKPQTLRLAQWIGHDPERLAGLMALFLGPDYRLNQRSAWVLMYVAQQSPALLEPWWPQMVAKARAPGIHDAVKRNVVRVLQDTDIPDTLLDELADLCFGFLADPHEAVAIRVYSMTILEKICRKIPELQSELCLLVEEHLEHGTPAFKNHGKKILKRFRHNS